MGIIFARLWGPNRTSVDHRSTEEAKEPFFDPNNGTAVDTCLKAEAEDYEYPSILYRTVLETTVDAARHDEQDIDADLEVEEGEGTFEIETNLWSPDVEDAVTKIQAGIRGYLVRKQMRVLQRQRREESPGFSEKALAMEAPAVEITQESNEVNSKEEKESTHDKVLSESGQEMKSFMLNLDDGNSENGNVRQSDEGEAKSFAADQLCQHQNELKDLPKVIEKKTSSSTYDPLEEQEAAIKIQAAFRSYQVRKTISHEANPVSGVDNEQKIYGAETEQVLDESRELETDNDEEKMLEISQATAQQSEERIDCINNACLDESDVSFIETASSRGKTISDSYVVQQVAENWDTNENDLLKNAMASIDGSLRESKTDETYDTISGGPASVQDTLSEKLSSSTGLTEFDLLTDIRPPVETELVDKIEKVGPKIAICPQASANTVKERSQSQESDMMILGEDFINSQELCNLIDLTGDLKVMDSIVVQNEDTNIGLLDVNEEPLTSEMSNKIESEAISHDNPRKLDSQSEDKSCQLNCPIIAREIHDDPDEESKLSAELEEDSELAALISTHSSDESGALTTEEPNFRPRSPNPFGKKKRRGKRSKPN